MSMMLAPEDFIINYWAKSIEAAPASHTAYAITPMKHMRRLHLVNG